MSDQLFDAIREGDHGKLEQILYDHPEWASARDGSGVSAILFAKYRGQFESIRLLRRNLGDLDLFEAAALGEEDRVRAIIGSDAGAARSFSPDGFSALHLAAFFRHEPIARILIAKGADVGAVSRNAMSVAPLHSAASAGAADIVEELLQAGANPNEEQHGGWVPLHAAALNGDEPTVRALLSHGADPHHKNEEGRTPAQIARERGHLAIAEMIERG